MKRSIKRQKLMRFTFAVGLVMLALPCMLHAEIPYPDIPKVPKAKAEQCVEPTEIMRRNHMEFILHQRDETMHQGIRTTKHSLKECISCHVNPTADGQYPRAEDKEHFCSSCHHYASVKIDCFECHADRPQPKDSTNQMSQKSSHQYHNQSKDIGALTSNTETKPATEAN